MIVDLRHHPDVAAQGRALHGARVLPAHQHGATLRVVQPVQ